MKYLFLLIYFSSLTFFGQQNENYNGFLTKDIKGNYSFYETRHDSLLPARMVIFKNVDTTGFYKIAHHNFQYNGRHVEVSGRKIDGQRQFKNGLAYDKIEISHISDYSLVDFYSNNRHNIIEYVSDSIFTGFYVDKFEGQAFLGFENGRLEDIKGWTSFNDKKLRDSIRQLPGNYGRAQKGILLTVKGKKQYGNVYGYGHFGMGAYEMKIEKVLSIDTTVTLETLKAIELEKGLVYDGVTIPPPSDFKIGQKYFYKYTKGKYAIHLEIEKKGPGRLKCFHVIYKNNRIVYEQRCYLTLEVDRYIGEILEKCQRQSYYTYIGDMSLKENQLSSFIKMIVPCNISMPPPYIEIPDVTSLYKNVDSLKLELSQE